MMLGFVNVVSLVDGDVHDVVDFYEFVVNNVFSTFVHPVPIGTRLGNIPDDDVTLMVGL